MAAHLIHGLKNTLAGLQNFMIARGVSDTGAESDWQQAVASTTRMQEMIGSHVDPERLLQEAALLVDRSDIQEELVRLDTHVKHFLGLLDQGGEVGKKLDFLLQEMNREINTIASKVDGVGVPEMIITAKADLEKMREQVQNAE